MKLGEIATGKTFLAPDEQTKVMKVWIVDQRDGKQVHATRRDGRFAVFDAAMDVKPGPRPHGRRNK